MPIGHLLLALMVVAIWGFNFVVIALGLADVPPLFLTALRFLLAALPAVFFIERPKVPWRLFVGFGLIFGVVKFGLLFVGMKAGMPAGLSSIVLQMQAFFTIGFAFLLLGERPVPIQYLGAGLAVVGIAAIGATRWQGATFLPFALVITSAACWGIANILIKKAGRIDMLGFIVWTSLVPIVPPPRPVARLRRAPGDHRVAHPPVVDGDRGGRLPRRTDDACSATACGAG